MSNTAINALLGYHTSAHNTNITEIHFPDLYNALHDSSEIAEETVNIFGFYYSTLFVGYMTITSVLHKVLACMTTSDDSISFFTRSGLKLSRVWTEPNSSPLLLPH
jgi:hypothetical protein